MEPKREVYSVALRLKGFKRFEKVTDIEQQFFFWEKKKKAIITT